MEREIDRVVSPGPSERTVRFPDGTVVTVPEDWVLVPPGDAMLTRRVKERTVTWKVEVPWKRKKISKGLWAPMGVVERVLREVQRERASPDYQRSLEKGRQRRAEEQEVYAREFRQAVLTFLAFHPRHAPLAAALADAVCAQSVAVGSGTVARTERIPIADRAAAAVIAWLRHQTTGYDDMKIARVKGERRRTRQELASGSRRMLERYRSGTEVDEATCPLRMALSR